jgi:excisionase family DNA binding protein
MTLIDDLKKRKHALTVAEVAQLFNVSRQEIYKLSARQKLPSFRVAKAVRFDPGKIAEWIKAHSGWEP